MRLNGAVHLLEVRNEICAKTKVALFRRAARCGGKKCWLNHPVFMMPELWPRIGEQNEEFRKNDSMRKRFEKQASLSADEEQIRQSGMIAFAICAVHAFTNDIDSDAKLAQIRSGVSSQKMPMTSPEFPDEVTRRREY
jgi:hypothetical protein